MKYVTVAPSACGMEQHIGAHYMPQATCHEVQVRYIEKISKRKRWKLRSGSRTACGKFLLLLDPRGWNIAVMLLVDGLQKLHVECDTFHAPHEHGLAVHVRYIQRHHLSKAPT